MADERLDAIAPGRDFEAFVAVDGERVRRALVGFYGVEVGTEAAAEALAVAWSRWPAVSAMENPGGYVFRIGQSKARPMVRWHRRRREFPTSEASTGDATADASPVLDLLAALGRLRPAERAAVLLVKSYGYTYRDVAALLGTTEASVNNFVHRGLARLRIDLEERP